MVRIVHLTAVLAIMAVAKPPPASAQASYTAQILTNPTHPFTLCYTHGHNTALCEELTFGAMGTSDSYQILTAGSPDATINLSQYVPGPIYGSPLLSANGSWAAGTYYGNGGVHHGFIFIVATRAVASFDVPFARAGGNTNILAIDPRATASAPAFTGTFDAASCTRPFSYVAGQTVRLLLPRACAAIPAAMNDRGAVAGLIGPSTLFIEKGQGIGMPNSQIRLFKSPGHTLALGNINDQGVLVGYDRTAKTVFTYANANGRFGTLPAPPLTNANVSVGALSISDPVAKLGLPVRILATADLLASPDSNPSVSSIYSNGAWQRLTFQFRAADGVKPGGTLYGNSLGDDGSVAGSFSGCVNACAPDTDYGFLARPSK